MPKKHFLQYTVRDVPEDMDARLRESAALEGISLNLATLRALSRGLGADGKPVTYRSLRDILEVAPKDSIKAWRDALSEQDRTHPDDWR